MKKHMSKIVLFGLLLSGLVGCGEKFLETRPSDDFSDSAVFSDLESAQLVLTGAYDFLTNGRVSHYTNMEMFFEPDVMADDALVSTVMNYNRFVSSYQYTLTTNANHAADSWGGPYSIIDVCNGLLDNLAGFPQSAERDRIMGEAYALRAYSYHFVVRMFAKAVKHYPQNPGVVLRTTQSLDDVPRTTVTDAYELLKSDVENATKLLTNGSDRAFIDKKAAHAIAARVYLDLGDATNGIKHAKAALEGITLMSTADYTAKFNAVNSETLWAFTCPSDDVQTYYSIPAFWYYASGHDGSKYTGVQDGYSLLRVSKNLIDLFDDADIRKTQFPKDSKGEWLRYPISNEEGIITGGILTTKWKSNGSLGAGEVQMLRGSEMYLIIAELSADAGNSADALAALNTVRVARGLGDYTGSDLINEIQNERRRELFAEGHRLFDIKRRNLPMNRQGVDGHTLWSEQLNLEAGSDRLEMPIPQKELDSNKALSPADQNPHYRPKS